MLSLVPLASTAALLLDTEPLSNTAQGRDKRQLCGYRVVSCVRLLGATSALTCFGVYLSSSLRSLQRCRLAALVAGPTLSLVIIHTTYHHQHLDFHLPLHRQTSHTSSFRIACLPGHLLD